MFCPADRGISAVNYMIPVCTSFVVCKRHWELLTEKHFYSVPTRKGNTAHENSIIGALAITCI